MALLAASAFVVVVLAQGDVAGASGPTGVSLTSVSCTSSSFCMAVDTRGAALTYNGSTWSAPLSADSTGGPLTSVSCTSTTFCAAADGSGNALTYNGSTWSSTDADQANNITAVSCTSMSFCEAVDSAGNGVNYNGISWTQQLGISPGSVQISGVSCVSTSCVAQAYGGSGNHGYRLTYSGGSWSSTGSLGNPVAYGQVTCVSISPSPWCDYIDNAFNIAGVVTYYGPTSGSQLQYNDQLTSISCVSTSSCMATDEFGQAFTYDSNTGWSSASVDAGGKPLDSVSCTSSTFCMAVDGNGNALVYDGSWLSPQLIDVTGTPTSMSTSLSGASQSGTSISVPAGTAVSDQATMSGATSNAGGMVTYNVYSDSACTMSAGSGGTVGVSSASVPASTAVTLSVGTYYWKATYGGDLSNAASASTCGPGGEVETVTALGFHITTTSLAAATWGVTYGSQLQATGGATPYKWKRIGTLPKGLKLTSSGLLHGTPKLKHVSPGTYTFTAQEVQRPSRSDRYSVLTLTLL
jgi:hypothetical protein